MIEFQKVRWKNFLSTGNVWTEVQLNKHKSTLIVGKNGAGKSTILDAISFALYGKAFRKINKPQLMNSINQKDLLVEIEFKVKRSKYLIRRGIKPAIFEIWKNGNMLNQESSSKDYQAYLEETILKMNYKSFGQVVVLGSSTFVPFMQLPAQYRREVIEDLLDIQIFSTMNTLLKDKVLTNKNDSTKIKYDIDTLKIKIESAKEHNESIRKIKEGDVNRIRSKISNTTEMLEDQKSAVKLVTQDIADLTATISDRDDIIKKIADYRALEDGLKNRLLTIDKDIKFYHSNDDCPTCRQGIAHDFKESAINAKTARIEEIDGALVKLKASLDKIQDRLKHIRNIENVIGTQSLIENDHLAKISMYTATLAELNAELTAAEKEVGEIQTSNITEYETELAVLVEQQKQYIEDREALAVVGTLLKDGGIKTKIVKQYVPIMNTLINKYLAAMEFFVDFRLDESFNEKILSRFRDEFSYSSFSEGEKLRIDLALMFTWRAISKMRNSVTTNLLIMDEVLDGSLDQEGTDEFLKIINEITADSNVFVISHKGEALYDKFDEVIKFRKVKNFSQIG